MILRKLQCGDTIVNMPRILGKSHISIYTFNKYYCDKNIANISHCDTQNEGFEI